MSDSTRPTVAAPLVPRRAIGSISGMRLAFGILLVSVIAADAGEPPLPPAERARMLAELVEQVIALDRAIAASPHEVALHSRRGDSHLFLAHFARAVADFEKMIALDPGQDAPHWRLGIAYYFNGQYAASARQFGKYHAYDGRDRENGIWKFLSDAKLLGLGPARRAMLVYSRFDREPFPALYELLAGLKTTDDFFSGLKERGLADDPRVMFFAKYYAGLHEEMLGNHDRALALLGEAVASRWGRTAEGGPAYMWQMARLHFEMLETLVDPAGLN